MEAKAVNRFIPSSPRKMRLVVDLIRGISVDRAIEILHFQPKHASRDAAKTLRSAAANLLNTESDQRYEVSDLYVKAAFVDQGPAMKRVLPAPMGRAYRVKKRACHLTVIVATKD